MITPELKAKAEAAKPRMHAQMIHLMLTLLVGGVLSTVAHQPILMMLFLTVGWTSSIILFGIGPLPLWRIVASVASSGLFLYLFYRFALSSFFG